MRKMHDPATTTTVGTTIFPSPEPTNLPTTAISDMLNITCSTFESISGILNKKVFMHSEPLVIVIPFVFSMISKISSQNKKQRTSLSAVMFSKMYYSTCIYNCQHKKTAKSIFRHKFVFCPENRLCSLYFIRPNMLFLFCHYSSVRLLFPKVLSFLFPKHMPCQQWRVPFSHFALQAIPFFRLLKLP